MVGTEPDTGSAAAADDANETPAPPVGTLTGKGGDGKDYSASWQTIGVVLAPIPYLFRGASFFHFTLDGAPWPSPDWGLQADAWRITCQSSGVVTGIGGDGNSYREMWIGAGRTLVPVPYRLGTETYFSFFLDGTPWPSADWGLRMDSWTVACL